MELGGRVALVTGAGRRVGRALAEALGARGMRVAVHYHGSRAGADETCQAIVASGGEAEPFFVAQAAARIMRERGGAIVNIADLAAFETWPAYVPHGITKAGVVHLTKSLARVLAPRIRVNGIAPGTVLLPDKWDPEAAEHLRATTPLQRQGNPNDVAQAMLYLLDAEYVTGETILVDGGRHVRH